MSSLGSRRGSGPGVAIGCHEVEPLLSGWLDAELRAAERTRVAAHLQSCARCRRLVDGLRSTAAMLASAPLRRLPEATRAALLVARTSDAEPVAAGTDDGPRHRRRPARAGVLVQGLAAVAALVVVLATTALVLGGDGAELTRPQQRVAVPVEVFVVDHLAQSRDGTMPAVAPVIFESRR